MSTTAPITRDQVREALRYPDCSVPDFINRGKTSLFCSKVYISMEGDKLRFVELSFVGRVIRYITRGTWYSDTVFADKSTMDKVKEFVHGIKTNSMYHDPIATNLMPLVKTTSDLNCVLEMLTLCERKALDDRATQDVHADIQEIQRKAEFLEDTFETGDFSEEFLSAAISLARQNLKKDPEDVMWESLANAFDRSLTFNADFNKKLLREILGLSKGWELHSRKITVADGIWQAVRAENEKVNSDLHSMKRAATPQGNFKLLCDLKKLSEDVNNLEVLRPFLAQESGKLLLQQLKESLLKMNVYPGVVAAYLNDNQQIAKRCFYHADVGRTTLESRQTLIERVATEITWTRQHVAQIMTNDFSSGSVPDDEPDSFSFTCQRLLESRNENWRVKIADELKNPQYRDLVAARIRKDVLQGLEYDSYCQWIRDPKSPVGRPELEGLSQITGRPILIVLLNGNRYEWKEGVNLHLTGQPLFFYLKADGTWLSLHKRR